MEISYEDLVKKNIINYYHQITLYWTPMIVEGALVFFGEVGRLFPGTPIATCKNDPWTRVSDRKPFDAQVSEWKIRCYSSCSWERWWSNEYVSGSESNVSPTSGVNWVWDDLDQSSNKISMVDLSMRRTITNYWIQRFLGSNICFQNKIYSMPISV